MSRNDRVAGKWEIDLTPVFVPSSRAPGNDPGTPKAVRPAGA